MKADFEHISILGVRVDVVTLDELIDFTLFLIREQKKSIIANVNVYAVNLGYEVGWFRNFINHSRLVFCDGFGVKWIARFLKGKRLQRFTPPDWFGRLADGCVKQGFSMFFLGTRQTVVEKAAVKLKETYPELKIIGVHHGFFDKNVMSSDNQAVLSKINSLKPDILVVGFGMPIQEKWISENLDNLNVCVVFPVGAFFDYLAGEVTRAPRWVTENGMEWLGRLIIEPGRLWRRYVFGNPLFLWRVFIHHVLGFPLPN